MTPSSGLPTALSVLAVVLFAQDPVPEDAPSPRTPVQALRENLSKQLADSVHGSWELAGYIRDSTPAPSGDIDGAALFCDGFLAVIIHGIAYDELYHQEVPVAQAGIYRYRVDEFQALQTVTLMGHSSDLEALQFEREGVVREYRLQVQGDLMNMRHRAGTILSLSRTPPADPAEEALSLLQRALGHGSDPSQPTVEPTEADAAPNDEDVNELNAVMQQRREQIEALDAGLPGAWALRRFLDADGFEADPGEVSGYALVCDGFLALVIHTYGYDQVEETSVELAQSGLFRYRISEFGELETFTELAHANPFEAVDFEEYGSLRTYTAELEDDWLVLRHAAGTEFHFQRIVASEFSDSELQALEQNRGAAAEYAEEFGED